MLAWELERVDMGESAVGEKYELPLLNSPGDSAPGIKLVFKVKGAFGPPTGSGSGNLGGAERPVARSIECNPLLLCAAFDRRLVLEVFRLVVKMDWLGGPIPVRLSSSSPSSSCK